MTAPERHTDTARNKILNSALSDLDQIINGHDPETDTSINNIVWDRLDKLALEIEAKARAEGRREGLREAERIARDGLKRCTANNHTYATGGEDDLLAQSVAQEIVVGDILVAILSLLYAPDT